MNYNYFVILFKNKVKKRIIKKFITYNNAKVFFDKKKEESSEVIFDKNFENGKPCDYEIALVKKGKNDIEQIYLKDSFGRNVKTKLVDEDFSLVEISVFKQSEKIFDLQKNKKIFFEEFLKRYLVGDGVKMISSLNNKIIVQENDKIYLFSTKNENESFRFIDCLNSYLFKNKKGNCITVKDISSAQKKYLIEILSNLGIDKKILYRKFTTYPRSK